MEKILIITYYWPPSGGSGVQRWLKFIKYLPKLGYQPIVFAPENPDFSIKDHSLLKDIPPEVETITQPIWEPFAVGQKLLGKAQKSAQQGTGFDKGKRDFKTNVAIWIRGNLFIPDSRLFWVTPSVKFLKRYLRENHIKKIITNGPPHSVHLIGLKLKNKLDIKWLADFRDPWTSWDVNQQLYVSSPVFQIHRILEKKVLNKANLVTTVSPRLAQDFSEKMEGDTQFVRNGVDPEDFADIPHSFPDKFRVTYTGVMHEFRYPRTFWKSIQELIEESDDFAKNLEINLAGTISNYIIEDLKNQYQLGNHLKIHGYLPHNEVIKLYYSSALLLAILNESKNAQWIMPGKLYEYLYTQRPVFLLGPVESDAYDLLKELDTGFQANWEEKDKIKETIRNVFRDYKAGNLTQNINTESLTREYQTVKLSNLLNQL